MTQRSGVDGFCKSQFLKEVQQVALSTCSGVVRTRNCQPPSCALGPVVHAPWLLSRLSLMFTWIPSLLLTVWDMGFQRVERLQANSWAP